MKSFVSLNKNRDFIRAYKKGRSVVTPCLALYIRPNGLEVNRLGITVSKKIGKAVGAVNTVKFPTVFDNGACRSAKITDIAANLMSCDEFCGALIGFATVRFHVRWI